LAETRKLPVAERADEGSRSLALIVDETDGHDSGRAGQLTFGDDRDAHAPSWSSSALVELICTGG
jgi:hypothetical protein